MTRNQLIKRISEILDINVKPLAYKVLYDVFHEYETAYLKGKVRAYRVGNKVTEDDLLNYANEVCKIYGITLENLKSKERYHLYVMARVQFCRHMRLIHNANFVTLAKFLNRDHTTIIHYFKDYKVAPFYPENTRLKNDREADTFAGM